MDPDYFVEKDNKKAEEDNVCGNFCWEGCDDFDKNPAHPFCTHCSKITTETGNCCTGWCDTQKGQNPIRPSAPKIVRLAFHDCLKYEDGTGGCDGCLGWQGMGVTYRTKVSSTAPKYFRLLSYFNKYLGKLDIGTFLSNHNIHKS